MHPTRGNVGLLHLPWHSFPQIITRAFFEFTEAAGEMFCRRETRTRMLTNALCWIRPVRSSYSAMQMDGMDFILTLGETRKVVLE